MIHATAWSSDSAAPPKDPDQTTWALPLVRWWGRVPAGALEYDLPPTGWAVLAELARWAELRPNTEGWVRWSRLDGLAHPANVNTAAERLEWAELIEVDRSEGGHRKRARLLCHQWVPVPLIDPRRLDQAATAALPTLWAICETTLAREHRGPNTDPLEAWTADRWATSADVTDVTGTGRRSARRHLADLAAFGLIERVNGDPGDSHRYRPQWHLAATRRGAPVRAATMRDRLHQTHAETLAELIAEASHVLDEAKPAPDRDDENARQIARQTRDRDRHTSLTESRDKNPPNPTYARQLSDNRQTDRGVSEQRHEIESLLTAMPGTFGDALRASQLRHPRSTLDALAGAKRAGWQTRTLGYALDTENAATGLNGVSEPWAVLPKRICELVDRFAGLDPQHGAFTARDWSRSLTGPSDREHDRHKRRTVQTLTDQTSDLIEQANTQNDLARGFITEQEAAERLDALHTEPELDATNPRPLLASIRETLRGGQR